ncbi:Uncharacterised protein [Legionella busanensis]|uniref:Uncharacterized protein n=1 Tax=Legionella busanensis TaxID=190655 RepID=A0A378JW62_9GAMM|nr:hypothetical protein [Legionella busanensis]STX52452.1 Uncharacterised protein [Legionella busanensis]
MPRSTKRNDRNLPLLDRSLNQLPLGNRPDSMSNFFKQEKKDEAIQFIYGFHNKKNTAQKKDEKAIEQLKKDLEKSKQKLDNKEPDPGEQKTESNDDTNPTP